MDSPTDATAPLLSLHGVTKIYGEGGAAVRRNGPENDRLVMNIVVPIVNPSHHASRVRRIPLAPCAH